MIHLCISTQDVDPEAVEVVDDAALGYPVVQLSPPHGVLDFHVESDLPYVVFQVKADGDLIIKMTIGDQRQDESTRLTSKQMKTITLSNHVTLATIDDAEARLPLVIQEQRIWQLVPVHLPSLVATIWGTDYAMIQTIELRGSCSIKCGWVADRLASDVEMPKYLRAVKPPKFMATTSPGGKPGGLPVPDMGDD